MRSRRGGGGGGDHGGGGGGHDGAGGLRWLLTYADLITLLMVFFVVMYSISKVDTEKYKILAHSLKVSLLEGAAGNSVIDLAAAPVDTARPLDGIVAADGGSASGGGKGSLERIGAELEKELRAAGLSGRVTVNMSERGLVVSFVDAVFFDLAKADIRPDSREVLRRVANVLAKIPNKILVEGNTDNLPINTAQFPSNWELSAARAVAVARFLTEHAGIDPRRVGATGFGEWNPRYPNDTPENRMRNRRVDLVILRSGTNTKSAVPGASASGD